jgi:Na+/H+ antiporter NhaD/arsenite permease-like protein
MFPKMLPLGRPGSALTGAIVIIAIRKFGDSRPQELYPSHRIEWTVIFLLFGLMCINAYIEETGVYQVLGNALDANHGWKIITKLSFFVGLSSAVLTNDAMCLVLTPVTIKLCRSKNIKDMFPYLFALSTSANIGSCLTIVGNPQNAMIAGSCSTITFTNFLSTMALPVSIGLVLNLLFIFAMFRKDLFVLLDGECIETPSPTNARDDSESDVESMPEQHPRRSRTRSMSVDIIHRNESTFG